jgi:hypothetical protein
MSAARFRPGVELPAEQITANRRYWESEESVNGIAEAMDMSKGRLYELLLPFDAELACPSCGSSLGYPHRTARLRGDVECDHCGFEGSREEIEGAAGSGGSGSEGSGSGGGTAGQDAQAGDVVDAPPTPVARELWTPGSGATAVSQRTLAGALLSGLAVGIVIGGWLRR